VQVYGYICEAAGISFSRIATGYKVGWHNNIKRQFKGRGEINNSNTSTFTEM
jgi:hypothetical protein